MYPENMSPATFVAGIAGPWRIEGIRPIRGEPLIPADRLDVHATHAVAETGNWLLRGVAGHVRYVNGKEKLQLDAVSPPLGRAEATLAALIPIRKSPAWWTLPQDERRAIFEERSRHISDALKYL